jgi:hypothetical protein
MAPRLQAQLSTSLRSSWPRIHALWCTVRQMLFRQIPTLNVRWSNNPAVITRVHLEPFA